MCERHFFNKVAGLRPATLLKKSPWHRCFPVNFAEFLRTPSFTEHLWWLLLSIAMINIERSYANRILKESMNRIIDILEKRKDRDTIC